VPPDLARPIDVLLVEDDEGDVLMTREALQEGNVVSNLRVARDGVEAVDMLFQRGMYADTSRPDLVLLDLNLPRKDGLQVLAEIKAEPAIKRIPVVVLTTSEAEEDIVRSYDLHANAYVPKPVNFGRFVEVIRHIDHFFTKVAQLPPY
jgi:two-component system response regulator